MNDKKICFISCVNNESLYKEALYYINHLDIPEGYEIECISVENADYITSGYNKGMHESDAKYKVYLHQDVFIINKNFINDVLNIFRMNNNIGMIGVTGCKTIPSNGIWWESTDNYGKVYGNTSGNMILLAFQDCDGIYEKVQAIDGLIMITQYDIEWREDIFDEWHFYDLSQSMEFIRAGYDVVIPKQDDPWCVHDCGIIDLKDDYERLRKIFINEYDKDILPLVSILIPSYNQTKYLKEALESAISQTYPNIEIIIGDDSTNDEVCEFIRPYVNKFSNVKYFRNQRNEMDFGINNVENLFKLSKGEYIAYLFHDDVFHIEKIDRMMKYFLKDENISLVTSYRKLINEKSEMIDDLNFNKKLFESDTRISGLEASKYIISKTFNFIGEFSTAMFKKKDIEGNVIGYYTKKVRCNCDMTLWLRLLEKGDLIYISDCLNYFRQHENQNGKNYKMQAYGVIDSLNMVEEYYRRNYDIVDEKNYKEDLINCYHRFFYVFTLFDLIQDEVVKKEISDKYKNFIDII